MTSLPYDDSHSLSSAQQIDAICDRFELAWLQGERISIEKVLADSPAILRDALARELIAIEMELRRKAGEKPTLAEYSSYVPALSLANDEPTKDAVTSTMDTGSHPAKRIRYFGDYELISKVARGGMGTVYRANQLSLNRIVAIKMINSGEFASQEEISRFYSEAKAAASLDHPSIVPVYEVGEFEGDHFYSMAFVDGKSLAEQIQDGPLDATQAATLIQDVAIAVQYAHDKGIIHRDLKPSNILLDSLARPRVTDFGLAKLIADTKGITVSGEILGTPSFMAPEQAAGKINVVGFAADVYALGAVLYTCLSGRPPFQAASHVATLKQVIENEPVRLRLLNAVIPRDLETIAHKCLDKSIGRRYSSPKELADDLKRFLRGEPIHARPINVAEQSFRWCRRNPASAVNILGTVVVAIAAITAWMWMRAREREITIQEHAASLVDQLNVADESELPQLVQQIRRHEQSKGLLQKQFEESESGSTERYRAALGLLPGNESIVHEVCLAWLDASWLEWIYIRNQLAPQLDTVHQWIQKGEFTTPQEMDGLQLARFAAIEAAAAAATNRPSYPFSQVEWERIASTVMAELLKDPSQLPHVCQAFRTLHAPMESTLTPRLDMKRREIVPEASIAARMLSVLLVRQYEKLMTIGAHSKSEWVPILLDRARDDAHIRNAMLDILKLPIRDETWDIKIADCRRRAIAATILFTAGAHDSVWPHLCQSENPTVRSLIIEWLPMMQSDPSTLIQKSRSMLDDRPRYVEKTANLESHPSIPNPWIDDVDSSLLRSLLQAIGNYSIRDVQRYVNESWWNRIAERMEFDPDPGLRSTCEWLLRRSEQGAAIEAIHSRLLAVRTDREDWNTISNGHLMVRIHGPIAYEAGSDALDPFREAGEFVDPIDGKRDTWSEDHRHPKRIERSFLIAMHETTLAQMHSFDPTFHTLHNKTLGPKLEHPACRVSWRLAAAYCNWLSEKENIPEDQWCFVKLDKGDWQPASNYLERTGYRLPTEAEWEYACRAETTSRTYLGDSDELLLRNVCYVENSREKILSIPGSFKPNGFGLFDMLGNVQEWCMDGFDNRNPGSRFKKEDRESSLDLSSSVNRIIRGGSLYSMSYEVRATEYSNFSPAYREGNTGFRIARTIEDKTLP